MTEPTDARLLPVVGRAEFLEICAAYGWIVIGVNQMQGCVLIRKVGAKPRLTLTVYDYELDCHDHIWVREMLESGERPKDQR